MKTTPLRERVYPNSSVLRMTWLDYRPAPREHKAARLASYYLWCFSYVLPSLRVPLIFALISDWIVYATLSCFFNISLRSVASTLHTPSLVALSCILKS